MFGLSILFTFIDCKVSTSTAKLYRMAQRKADQLYDTVCRLPFAGSKFRLTKIEANLASTGLRQDTNEYIVRN